MSARLRGAVGGLLAVALACVPAGSHGQATITPPVTRAATRPRTVQVIVTPVPAELRGDTTVSYRVTPLGSGSLVGALKGTLGGGPDGASVIVTVSLPVGTPAGEQVVALVQFLRGELVVSETPVVVQVLQVRSVGLRLAQQLFGARPGHRIALRYFVTNTGNAHDSVDLTLAAPPAWSVRGLPAWYGLQPGETAMGEASVAIPLASPTGAFPLRLIASGREGELRRVEAVVELLGGTAGGAGAGPQLVASAASILGDSGRASPVFGLELSGPVGDRVQVFGRLVQPSDPGRADPRALARVGYFVGAPLLRLSAPRWELTAGTTGRSFSDATGVNLYGRGASFSWSGSRWRTTALAASPVGRGGRLFGAQVGARLGGGEVTVTATDLADPQLGGRRLAAIALGGTAPRFAGVTVSGELAHRRYATGHGLGWSTELKRHTRNEFAQLRVVGAPGGSAAFARAATEISATGSREITSRVAVGAGYWITDDRSLTFSSLKTRGWSLTPRLALSERTSLELEAQGNAFDASGPAGGFGNAETLVRVGVSSQHGSWYGSGSASLGRSSRSAALPGQGASDVSAGRQVARGLIGWVTDRAVLEASAAVERNGAGVGLLPRQYVIGVRADRVAVTPGRVGPMLNAELHRYGWFGDRPGVTVARIGMRAPLPAEFGLTVDIERNPFLTGLGSGARWIPVVKLERSVHVPLSAVHAAASGLVYQDRNANGGRDRGEPAVAGVVVRRGGETAVSDRGGRFKFSHRTAAPVVLDETSLPVGMVAYPLPAAERQARTGRPLELGVLVTAGVDVRLVPAADDDGRVPQVNFHQTPVSAINDAGDVWTARADSTGLARFQALPPGRYRLEFDFGSLREPVRLRGAVPGFTVEAGEPVPSLVVPVYPRPMRLFDPSNPNRRGGAPRQ